VHRRAAITQKMRQLIGFAGEELRETQKEFLSRFEKLYYDIAFCFAKNLEYGFQC